MKEKGKTVTGTCSCGHCHGEHSHGEEKSCSCGHKHSEAEHGHASHSHKHENHVHTPACSREDHSHESGCPCGHEDHAHGDGCACGHEHTHEEGDSPAPLILSVILFAAGLLMEHVFGLPVYASAMAFGLCAVISGYRVFFNGLKGLLKLKFNENALMTIAIITAFCLGEFGEAAAVAILFSLGEIAEGAAERNSRRSIKALTEIRPDTARLLTPAGETTVAAEAVQVGDRIAVNPFERIPVDGVITEGSSYVDNSALTGESLPINVTVGDSLLSGGINGSTRILMESTADFSSSTSSRILKLIEESSAKKGETEKLITRFARVYTPIVLILAVLIAFLPPLLGAGSVSTWLYRALVMLVASCPCALVISVPLGFFAGIGAQSKIGVLIKGGKYLEALSKADAIAFDKTGTITTSKLRIASVTPCQGFTEKEILSLAAAAEALSTHPVGKAICAAAGETAPAEDISETPGKGITAQVNGQSVAVGRRAFLTGLGVALREDTAYTVQIAVDGKEAGGISLTDTVKEDSPAAIAALKALNIGRIVMLTGDNSRSAKEVADLCGITEYHASLLPGDKAEFVEKLPGKSRIFVGDGVNDAPVLAAADCGVAIGLGSQAAIETADAVLSAGNLSVLPKSISLAKKALGIIRFNIIFAIAFKAVILVLAGLGYAPMWLGIVADVGVMVITVLNAMRLVRTPGKAK